VKPAGRSALVQIAPSSQQVTAHAGRVLVRELAAALDVAELPLRRARAARDHLRDRSSADRRGESTHLRNPGGGPGDRRSTAPAARSRASTGSRRRGSRSGASSSAATRSSRARSCASTAATTTTTCWSPTTIRARSNIVTWLWSIYLTSQPCSPLLTVGVGAAARRAFDPSSRELAACL
jgi:hypothetical protein